MVAARRRPRPLCRRRRGDRRRRDQGPGARRRRSRRHHLQGKAGRRRCRRRAEARRAAGASRSREQPDLRLGAGRRRRHRRGDRQGRACDEDAHRQQPAGAQRDGAARRTWPVRQGRRPLHLLDDLAEPASGAAGHERLLQCRAGEQAARHRAGRRRRLRLEDLHLSGRDRLPVGLQEDRRAGQMGRRPHRELPDRRAWPRPCLGSADGLRQGQQDHRPQGRHHRQSRRLHVAVLVLRADLSLRDAAVRPVRHPGDLRQCPHRLHQHRAGRRLSRGRAAGGHLRGRAHDRDGGARTRRVAGGTAPQELHHRPSRTRRRSS